MRKPSASMVVAIAALVMATTGTSIAASNYLITSSSQVKNGSLSASDLSSSARRSLRGRTGARGASGVPGAAGIAGAAGRDGANGRDGVPGRDGAAGRNGSDGQTGPSDAYIVAGLGTANGIDVPAGSYIVGGNVYMAATNSTTPQCIVWHGGGTGSFGSASSGATYSLPVADTFTVTGTTHVYVTCSGYNTNLVTSADVHVVKVGTLHR